MSAPRFILPIQQWLTTTGNVGVGYSLTFYVSGTDTLSSPYADANLSANLPQPVEQLAGFWPAIFLNPSISYKVVLQDQNGAQIWTADPVTALSLFVETAFQCLGTTVLTGSEVIGIKNYPVATSYPANFQGSVGLIINFPTAPMILTAKDQAGNQLGTATIDTGAAWTFATTGQNPVSMAAGSAMIWRGPASADITGAILAWSLVGVISQ